MPREPSCTGMWDKEWNKGSFQKLDKIWQRLRKIMMKLEQKQFKNDIFDIYYVYTISFYH